MLQAFRWIRKAFLHAKEQKRNKNPEGIFDYAEKDVYIQIAFSFVDGRIGWKEREKTGKNYKNEKMGAKMTVIDIRKT